jgi:heat shock protein beta
VADKVTVISKAKDGPQLRWESESANKYTITEDESPAIEGSGTRLVLSMKEDMEKYCDDYTLRTMLKKYSQFLQFPIEIWAEKTEYETVPDMDANVTEGEERPTKTVPKTTNAWDQVNVAEPLWMREPDEVMDEDYTEFYKTTFGAYDEPMAKLHFSLEGQVEFRALVFLPPSVPWELSQDMFNTQVKPIKLYVKRVFISDQFSEELIPRWLQFMKGLVDSDDLPLNVSREILQKSRILTINRKRLVKKIIAMISSLKSDETKWDTFNQNFGKYVKVGLIEDKENKDDILKLAAFPTSASDKPTTFGDYISRMKEGQKQIYYVSGASRSIALSSPALENLQKKGYEVLISLDQIDEVALQNVGKVQEFEVVDAAKENAKVEETEEEKADIEKAKMDFNATTGFLKEVLGEKVDKVEVSSRLESSPCALVQPQWGMSPAMQRFMKAQAMNEKMGAGTASPANLEINANHEVIKKMQSMVAADGDKASEKATNYAKLVYDIAAVSSGWELKDPADFSKRVAALMEGGADKLGSLSEETATETEEPKKEVKVTEAEEIETVTPEVLDP